MWQSMKKRRIIVLIVIVLAGWATILYFTWCFNNITPNITDETNQEYIEGMAKCEKLMAYIDTLPKEISLFGKTLSHWAIDCQKEITDDSYMDDANMFYVPHYVLKNTLIITYKNSSYGLNKDIWDVINWKDIVGQSTTFGGLWSAWNGTDAAFMPLQDITDSVDIAPAQKEQMWTYKVFLNFEPTGDGPQRGEWRFIISIVGTTGDLIYYTESKVFEIPNITTLLKLASSYIIYQQDKNAWLNASFDGTVPTDSNDKKNFDTLVEKYMRDDARQEADYSKAITYTAVQYISSIIQGNPDYQKLIKEKAEELVKTRLFN